MGDIQGHDGYDLGYYGYSGEGAVRMKKNKMEEKEGERLERPRCYYCTDQKNTGKGNKIPAVDGFLVPSVTLSCL